LVARVVLRIHDQYFKKIKELALICNNGSQKSNNQIIAFAAASYLILIFLKGEFMVINKIKYVPNTSIYNNC
jgi:hypothetical protein